MAKFDFIKRSCELSSSEKNVKFKDPKHDLEISTGRFFYYWNDEKYQSGNLYATDNVELSHGKVIHLLANQAYLDSDVETILLDHPIGTITSSLFKSSQKRELNFTSERLHWDQKEKTLKLQENAEVEEESFGTLFAKDSLLIEQGEKKDSFYIKSIKTVGESFFTRRDGLNLSCDGSIYFNPETMELVADQKNRPLEFHYSDLVIQAERASLSYFDEKPSKITFTNQVKLFNEEVIGKADTLTYDLVGHKITLEGDEVLFWDQSEHLHMAAEKLEIEHHEESHKNRVKGIGKVRFEIDENEKNNLLTILESCMKNLF